MLAKGPSSAKSKALPQGRRRGKERMHGGKKAERYSKATSWRSTRSKEERVNSDTTRHDAGERRTTWMGRSEP